MWTAIVDTGLEGERGSMRLSAGVRPGLRLDGSFSHNLLALGALPGHSRMLVTGRSGTQGYDAEALLQMGECALRATGAVMTGYRLQGTVVYHNNCTVLQVREISYF